MTLLSTTEAVQKQIEHVLTNRYTSAEIADNYLKIPFNLRPSIVESDREVAIKNLVGKRLDQRRDHEQLAMEIVRAVSYYEIPVLSEQRGNIGHDLDRHLDNASQNREEAEQDVLALSRVLLQPLTPSAKLELTARRDYLQEVLDQGYIYISRQQEIALRWLSATPGALPLIFDFALVREPNQPEQVYTRSLALIVFKLLESHARDAKQKAVERNTKLAADIIAVMSPNLEKHITPRTIKQARTGH